jgi:5-methyltetrahydrofolate corrinoid/iron sulfur protein methyltransferase
MGARRPAADAKCTASGGDAVILVAENLTVTNPEVARSVREADAAPLRELAKQARRAGAAFLDVNLGTGRWGGPDPVEFVLQALRGCWEGGVLADTLDPAVMERACDVWPGPVVLNGYSGDPGREGILEVAAERGTELVVLLMAGGIPRGVDARLALAAELVGRCAARGVAVDRLWIDPVVAPLGWVDGQEHDAALLEVLRRLPEVLGQPVRSVVGLSNLTTGAAGGRSLPWLQEVFLAAAAGAGLTHAMLDIRNAGLLRTARALGVLRGHRLFAPAELA